MKKYSFIILVIFIFGLPSGCSNPVNTKTINLIPPTLISPPNGAPDVELEETFVWSGACNRLEIDYTPSFNVPVFSRSVTGTQYKLPPGVLAYNAYYYWRCGLVSGSTVVWSSPIFGFKTKQNP